ncbi:PASTA domain-containing protein [Spirochaeta isovalerica]|uniref:Beta-lactam-binding protein with PASTA domain n=1 Tax=Spirochaeta isovalerica TaxID=150 RepID=A0A841R6H0_9SPIO|nr:PASTA domain-containing protein [Spirochaeta isovalerica]MBB6480794.1 beta-lactam-binding protein with PASTA domain [Spirochaeta isovalerica]
MNIKSLFKLKGKEAPGDSLNEKSEQITDEESTFFKRALYIIIAVFAVMFFSFSITFFLSIRGEEKTAVPDVEGMELVEALIDLQVKELYPRVQVRYSDDPMTKGTIIKQDPPAGAVVKAGRRVTITVSKGAVVDKVGDYIGMDLNDVKVDFQIQFTTYKPNLVIKEPVIYEYDSTPPGTIIAQNPEPGTAISGLTEVEFVVSRGEPGEEMVVGDYMDMSWSEVVRRLTRANIPFVFSVDYEAEGNGNVIEQEPAAGESVKTGSVLSFTIAPPEETVEGMVFGLFEYSVPEYPVYVDMKFESFSPSSRERRTIFETKHPGGKIAIPYKVPVDTELILSILDKEVIRYKVTNQ